MSRRSLIGGVNVGISPDASSSNHINNNIIVKTVREKDDDKPNDVAVNYDPEPNPYADIPNEQQQTRDIESAKQTLKAFNHLGISDTVYAEALALIIDIIQNNPLIQSHYIIAHTEELSYLIKILTESDKVELNISEDAACCGIKSIAPIESIYTIKNSVTSEFKYSYPLVKSLLNQLRISTKFVSII